MTPVTHTTPHPLSEASLAEDIGMFLEDRADHFIYWCDDPHAYTEKQVQAIAPKLTAAPAMYEALKDAIACIEQTLSRKEINERRDRIIAALAQAEEIK